LVKTECYPKNPCKRTMRSWINHYIFYGETPTETRNRNRKLKLGHHVLRSVFGDEDIEQLHAILESQPDLYLDEIQSLLLTTSQKLFAISSIYDKMKSLGYSLKVAYEKSCQRDELERAAWRTFILERGPDVWKHLIFVDETHKSIKDMRRRRHWVLKGRGQPFVETYFYGDNRDIRCVYLNYFLIFSYS
jgi:hypothetical protein